MNQKFKRYALSAFFVIFSLVYGSSQAGIVSGVELKSLDSEITIRGLHNDFPRILKDGDALFSGDSFHMTINTESDAYVYAFMIDSSGEIALLNPDNQQATNGELLLPAKDLWYQLDANSGKEQLIIVVSRDDLDTADLIMDVKAGNISSKLSVLHRSINHASNAILDSANGLLRPNITPSTGSKVSVADLVNVQKQLDSSNLNLVNTLIGVSQNAESDQTTRGIEGRRVFKTAAPSVVLIASDTGEGSGSVISEDGLILTNWHVVEGSNSLTVFFKPNHREVVSTSNTDYCMADIVGLDRKADLALIKTKNCNASIQPLSFGSADSLEVGQDLHAIGHPTGLEWTYTVGVVSKLRDNYQWSAYAFESEKGETEPHLATIVIQTQTPINPGNSGGPLLNDKGEIVGINTMGLDEYEGLNFAVSAEDAKRFIDKYKAGKTKKVEESKSLAEDLSEKWGVSVLAAEEDDINQDGTEDLIVYIDSDANGVADTTLIRYGKNAEGDTILIDSDEDGAWNEVILDTDNNGESDTHLYDLDGDGNEDVIGHDNDEDGEVDEYQVVDEIEVKNEEKTSSNTKVEDVPKSPTTVSDKQINTEALKGKYSGEVKDELPHGSGEYTGDDGWHYLGEFANGLFNGKGVRTNAQGDQYEGDYVDGEEHGQGVFVWANGNRYEGDFKAGYEDGEGLFVSDEGWQYEGEFSKGWFSGYGEYKSDDGFHYLGEFAKGKFHGKGVRTSPNGNKYEGNFVESVEHGWGVFTWSSGTTYEGEIDKGKMHGHGTVTWENGERYIGNFVQGVATTGIQLYPDGTKYKGEFKDKLEHGQGVVTYPDGLSYTGEFKYGYEDGQGVMTWPGGETLSGEFKEGNPVYGKSESPTSDRIYEGEFLDWTFHGQGVMTWADGGRYEGKFKDGFMDGKGVYTWQDGRYYEGEWKKDKHDGPGVITLANGSRFKQVWKDGKLLSSEKLN